MKGGESVSYFWLFDLPALPQNETFSDLADRLHLLGQWAVFALALLHLAAVVYHVGWRHDGLLDRMLPPLRGR